MTVSSTEHPDGTQTAREQRVYWLSLIIGAILVIIGIRFFLTPGAASYTFGVAHPPEGDALHFVIGVRDIWLGGLAMAFAWFREWRALALWLVGAALVCWTDAVIVNASTGNPWALAFHGASGVLTLALARGAWILSAQQKNTAEKPA